MKNVFVDGKAITPPKIICVGRNYVEHIAELGNERPDNMVLFIKPNVAIGSTLIAFQDEPIHYEAELCFMINGGKLSAVTIGLDLTKRALQTKLKEKGLPWERAKVFEHSVLFGEFVSIDKFTSDLSLELTINNALVQAGSVKDMIYKPNEILQEVRSFITLEDGDIIMTGTPKGVGVIKKGDKFTGRILSLEKTLSEASWTAE